MKFRISVLNCFVVLESENDVVYVWLVEEVTPAEVEAILGKIQEKEAAPIEVDFTPEVDDLLFQEGKRRHDDHTVRIVLRKV